MNRITCSCGETWDGAYQITVETPVTTIRKCGILDGEAGEWRVQGLEPTEVKVSRLGEVVHRCTGPLQWYA